MSKLNTNEIREEGRCADANETYNLLCEALDEIDEQAAWFAERDDDPKLFSEEVKRIEQRTKDAIEVLIKEIFPIATVWRRKLLEAIDSAGNQS